MCAWSKLFYYGLYNYAFSSSGFIPSNIYTINEWGNANYLEERGCHFSSTDHNFLSFQVVSFPCILNFPQLSVQIFCSQKRSVNGDFAVHFFSDSHWNLRKQLSCYRNLSGSETVIADMKTVSHVPLLDSIVVVYASREGKCWNPELYNQLDLEAPFKTCFLDRTNKITVEHHLMPPPPQFFVQYCWFQVISHTSIFQIYRCPTKT